MEADLRALLAGYAPLTNLVSTRIVWNEIPQGSADPNVSLFKVAGGPEYTHQGADGLASSIVQINVRALTYASMIAVRNAIVAKLSGFRGTQGATFFGAITIQSERQNSEKPSSVLYHTDQIDVQVWHSPA